MYLIIVEHRFFCNGEAFDQLVGVEPTAELAERYREDFIYEHPELSHHSVVIEERVIY